MPNLRGPLILTIVPLIITIAIIFSVLFLKISITGLFAGLLGIGSSDGGVWENKIEITVNSSVQVISTNLIFGQYKSANCSDGIYIEALTKSIPFETQNELHVEGLCSETDVIFNNIIYTL